MINYLKKHVFLFLCASLFIFFSYISINYSQSFELSWNENDELFEINQNFSEMWIFNKNNLMPPDRGIIYPLVNRILISIFGINIKILRLFSTFFYLASIFLFFKILVTKEIGIYFGSIATILLATHLNYLSFLSLFLLIH